MTCTTERLMQAFTRLVSGQPDIAKNKKPFGMGNTALIVHEKETDTLTKVVFRKKSASWRAITAQWFDTEVNVLRDFSATPLQTVCTPIMIDEPKIIDSGRYYGTFQMTRIDGRQVFHSARTQGEHLMFQSMHRAAGRLLARFHEEVADRPLDIPKTNKRYTEPACCSTLPDILNEAFERVRGYISENARPGIVHNDFHKGNVLFDNNGNTAGVIDFSAMCHSTNLYDDFMCVPDTFMPDFVAGYEEETGRKVDSTLLDATKLCCMIAYIDKCADDPAQYTNTVMAMNEHLNRLVDVTGFKP